MTPVAVIPVLMNDTLRSWPKHGMGGRADYTPLGVALAQTYRTDAHFAAYSVPYLARRLSTGALRDDEARATLADGIAMVAAVFDVDCPEAHTSGAADVVDRWWMNERPRVGALLAAHPGGFVYRTRGGYRIVFVLPESVVLRDPADEDGWKLRYASWIVYLRRAFGIVADEACKDWTRLYRLPHATRDNGPRPERRETIGDTSSIGAWTCQPTTEDIEAARKIAKKRTPKKKAMPAESAARLPTLPPGDGVLVRLFASRGWLGSEIESGKWAATCPNASAHTKGDDLDGSTILYAPSDGEVFGWLHCSHAHCQGLTLRDVLRSFGQAEIDAVMPKVVEFAPAVLASPPPTSDAAPLPTESDFHDVGNARRLVRLHGQDLLYVPGLGAHVWDGRRFRRDETGGWIRAAKASAESFFDDAKRAPSSDLQRAIAAHAIKSLSAPRLQAAVTLAQSDLAVLARVEDLDADPWALNVRNGILDLRTGALRPHDRAARMTRLAEVEYHPDAQAPRFRAFLDEVQPDPEVRDYVQREAGYALTAFRGEQHFSVYYGGGSNGKSTLLELLRDLLGSYAAPAPQGCFLASRSDRERYDLATFPGVRLVIAAESAEGAKIDEALLKALTGGEGLRVRHPYEGYFDFRPQFFPIMVTNHRPRVVGTDLGIWRRLRLVPWVVTIPDARKDRNLKAALLAAEGPGILRWMVEGCLAYQRGGLCPPKAVLVATNEYRSDEDQVGEFLTEKCRLETGLRARAGDLYKSYVAFVEEGGERPLSQRAFGLRLSERGLERFRSGGWWWRGIALGVPSGPMDPYESHLQDFPKVASHEGKFCESGSKGPMGPTHGNPWDLGGGEA